MNLLRLRGNDFYLPRRLICRNYHDGKDRNGNRVDVGGVLALRDTPIPVHYGACRYISICNIAIHSYITGALLIPVLSLDQM